MKTLPKPSAPLGRLAGVAVAALAIVGGPDPRSAHAFPPAPHHTLFGQVRDELGNPLAITTAEVVLVAESGVTVRTRLAPGLKPGQNYEIEIPMDAGLTRDMYKPTALKPTLAFRMKVRIGATDYLPIEMRGDASRLGQPAGRTRLDLTLGEDSDGDGLPDAWERALLAASGGRLAGLGDVNAGDDFDGDGLSNLKEYFAGTYAFDPADGFSLTLASSDGAASVMEFLAIRGRAYTIEGTADLKDWRPVPFRVVSPVADTAVRDRYQATDVEVVRVRADSGESDLKFYRLLVR